MHCDTHNVSSMDESVLRLKAVKQKRFKLYDSMRMRFQHILSGNVKLADRSKLRRFKLYFPTINGQSSVLGNTFVGNSINEIKAATSECTELDLNPDVFLVSDIADIVTTKLLETWVNIERIHTPSLTATAYYSADTEESSYPTFHISERDIRSIGFTITSADEPVIDLCILAPCDSLMNEEYTQLHSCTLGSIGYPNGATFIIHRVIIAKVYTPTPLVKEELQPKGSSNSQASTMTSHSESIMT